MARDGRRIDVRGTVQGVGYRPWVYRLASDLGIAGQVRNGAAGVTIDAFGPPAALDDFTARLAREGPPASAVTEVRWQPLAAEPPAAFAIAASEPGGERRLAIPPDLALCAACRAEIFDPADRRYRYPFTNCTECGPRFTIAVDVPYDRAATTMTGFAMCADCRREYQDPRDRRFHAEPIACPACGPRLRACWPDGLREVGDPFAAAARFLSSGLIVAVKGLGGWHLACDAASPAAVERLRARKRRDVKPFAVMVRDLAAAEALAWLGRREAKLLASPVRPIVLVDQRPLAALASSVAPGSALVGLMLPYTPLHDSLLAAAGGPLVMTSGNLADEPIVHRDHDAFARLGEVADLFLLHDRPIAARCDDSVAAVVAGHPVVLRRSRGHVPAPIRLAAPVPEPILAVGGDVKNAFCIAAGDAAWLGPHVGDLERLDNLEALAEAVNRLECLLRVRPAVVAHDLHPGYASTAWALGRAARSHLAVQHHHAHVAACLAENGLSGPALGFAWDGTGYGTDGTAWGGELLLVGAAGFERLATFRPLRLAGGERAVRQVWRLALAAVDDAFAGDAPIDRLALFRALPPARIAAVRRVLAVGEQTPLASGVGRWFDAFGALGLGLIESRHEAEVALRWDQIADDGERRHYPYCIDDDARPWQVNLRPAVRRAVGDLLAGRSPATVSARFHNTLIDAGAELARAAARDLGELPIVLSGGCFANRRLAEGLSAALGGAVRRHRRVPPGDGGLALGQAVVAAAQLGRNPCV